MKTQNRHVSLPQGARVVLLSWLLLTAVGSRAQAPQPVVSIPISSRPIQRTPVHIGDVFHIVGVDNKPGGTGDLTIDEMAITLQVHGHSTVIPLGSVLAFSLAPCDKPLISGTKGKVAQALPYGVGFAVKMSRPAAESLTLLYRDSSNAVHGGVLVLPKETEERVVSALAEKLSPTDYPKTGNLVSSEPQRESGEQAAPAPRMAKPDIEVALPSESVDGIPSAVPAVVFEDVIAQLMQSGHFEHVWRSGDIRSTPDTLLLHLDLEGWKQGSARGRAFGPFTGATAIQSKVTLEDRSGRVIFQGKAGGSKRTDGENLDAANGLAKKVRKVLEKAPDLQTKK